MPVVVPVKFTYASRDLWFDPQDLDIMEGDFAICRTERGTEIGLVTRDPFEAPEEELAAPLKPVLRIADDDDLELADDLALQGEEAMPEFRRLIKKNGLDMKPVGVEYLFGGEKVVFYFAAEERVDFRQLVRDLSSSFHMRVDMRQIGVRDETRLVGGYGQCGQELCCARLGGNFEPVSIRMAKEQDLPLNSSKISGMCGRLMCCLRYEFEAYKDFKGRAPKKKAVIDTPLGKARIVEYNTPREQLVLRLENGKSFRVDLADMTCSDEAQKRADEQGYTCRPDCVTRDVLNKIDSPEMRMALIELDRKNGVDVGDGLSQDDIIDDDVSSNRQQSRGGQQQSRRSGQGTGSSNRSGRSRGGSGQGQSQSQGGKGSRGQGQGSAQSSGKGQGSGQGQRQGSQNGTSGAEGASSRRRRHHTASEAASSEQGQTSSQQSQQGGGNRQQSQSQQSGNSRRRRQHVDGAPGSPSASGAAHVQGSSATSASTSGSRPRRHTTANGEGGSRQGSSNTGSAKPNVPSVADQVSDGSVTVARRHPGDGGGQKASQQGGQSDRSQREGQKTSQQSGQSQQGGQSGQSGQPQQGSSSRRRRHRSHPSSGGGPSSEGAAQGPSPQSPGGERPRTGQAPSDVPSDDAARPSDASSSAQASPQESGSERAQARQIPSDGAGAGDGASSTADGARASSQA